jgi:hypothetical protein
MYEVVEIKFGCECRTRIWISSAAMKAVSRLRKKGDPNGQFLKKLKSCAVKGFDAFQSVTPPIIRFEWEGIYRVGFSGSLFRLIGFYENNVTKADFIVIDTLFKSGQSLNAAERKRINAVVQIKKKVLWKKVYNEKNDPGSYPRMAR